MSSQVSYNFGLNMNIYTFLKSYGYSVDAKRWTKTKHRFIGDWMLAHDSNHFIGNHVLPQ